MADAGQVGSGNTMAREAKGNGPEGNSVRTFRVVLSIFLAAATVLAACGPTSSEPATGQEVTGGTVALSGEELLEARCTVCHSSDLPKQENRTSDQWETLVTRMMSKGAHLTDEEKAVLVEYLAATYGP